MKYLPGSIFFLLLLSISALGQPRLAVPCRFTCNEAVVEYAAGVAADIASQLKCQKYGGIEKNALFASNGKVNIAKAVGINAAIGAAIYIARRKLARTNTDAKIYEWMLRAFGYAHYGAAISNYRLASDLRNGR